MAKYEDNRPFKERNRIYIYPVILAFIVTMFVRPITSDGIAMEPGIQDGEVIIVSKQTYTPKRGAPDFLTVVAFRDDLIDEGDKGDNTIRRVVGVPGDTIKIENGKVYRNGKALREDYAIGVTEGNVEEVLLLEDEVFVLGDNRENSIDSRDSRIGPVKMNTIRGDCWLRVWPLRSFGIVK
ncbi:MAG: signal peptidase I [Anaerovoracaceae bacterium]